MPTTPKTYTRTETYYNERYVTPDNPTGKFTRTYTGDSAYSINESTQITQTSPQPQGTYSGNVFIPDSAVQPQEPTPEVKQPVVQDLFKQMEAENKKQQSPSQVPNIERVDLTTPRQAPPRMISRQETQPSQQQYVEQFLPTKDEVRGEVRAVEKPKSNLEALRKYTREGEDIAQQRGYGGSVQTNPVTLMGASAVVEGADVIIHPVQTTKGIAQSFIHPIKTLKETGKQLETSPANLIGTVAGQTAVLGGATKIFKETINPKEIGVTKSATVTTTTPNGFVSESLSQSVQKIGGKEYLIDTTTKGKSLAEKGMSKTTSTSEIKRIIAGQNIPKKTITTTTIGIEKGNKGTYLTKGTKSRQLDIVVAKEEGEIVKLGGVQYDVGKELSDLKLKNIYAGASKKVLEKSRTTEYGSPFDTTTVFKTGTVNIGLNEKLKIVKNIKPEAQQIKILKNFNERKSSNNILINKPQNTASPQVTELISKREAVKEIKNIYVEESKITEYPLPKKLLKDNEFKTENKQIQVIRKENKYDVLKESVPIKNVKQEKSNEVLSMSDVFQILKPKVKQAQSQDSSQDKIQKQKVIQISESIQEQEQKQSQQQQSVSKLFKPQVPKPKLPLPVVPKIKAFVSSPKSKESKFSVLVRRRGKFEKRGEAKTKEEAIRRGKFITSNTATASFKILNKGETVDVGNIGDKYTASKKEKGVLIQKNKFRISTVGEKAEIPYSANKNKKIFGGKLI